MHPRINTPVNSKDPLHSMMQLAEAAALIKEARELIWKAHRLVKDEWSWHREDDNWTLPQDIDTEAKKAMEWTQSFNASVHWTINSLRKTRESDKNNYL